MPPIDFKKFIDQYPGAHVVTYINCSAEIKALSTIVCTSSNARRVIESIPEEETIIFAPDKNLGNYLIKETGRDMILWNGSCIVQRLFLLSVLLPSKSYPNAKFIAHPERSLKYLKLLIILVVHLVC